MRTGLQPDNKTRLVIETSSRPSYSLSYPKNSLIIKLSNTAANDYLQPKMVSGTLIESIKQKQSGDSLQIIAKLNKSITSIPSSQIQMLDPSGENKYRIVLDFNTHTQIAAVKQEKKIERKNVIVIDAGHGGKDPGCIGATGIKEKNIVLSVAKKLKTKLTDAGFTVYLTRSKDVFLNLGTRADIAEKHKADLFISLHANANPSRKIQGFSVYTLSKKASDQEAQKLADAENASDKIDIDGFEKFEPDVRNALSSLQQHAVSEMSVEYANGLADSFDDKNILKLKGPDVRHAPFAVLRSTIPGALIELGHLSNSKEEKLLNSDSYQDKLVNAIAGSVAKYNFES